MSPSAARCASSKSELRGVSDSLAATVCHNQQANFQPAQTNLRLKSLNACRYESSLAAFQYAMRLKRSDKWSEKRAASVGPKICSDLQPRQGKTELRATAYFRFNRDGSAVLFDHFLYESQTQSGGFFIFFLTVARHAIKLFPDAIDRFGRNTVASIFDNHSNRLGLEQG